MMIHDAPAQKETLLDLRSLVTESEMAPLEEHLLICEECRDRLLLIDFELAL